MADALIKDLKKTYEEANDQHVGIITLYGDSSASKVYADASKKLTMDSETKAYVYRMAQMGRVVVSMSSKLYRPVAIDENGGTLSVVTVTSSGTSTATPLVLELQ